MGAGLERERHAPGPAGDAAAEVGQGVEVGALLGGGTADLLDRDDRRRTPPAGRVRVVRLVAQVGGEVVVDQHHLGRDVVVLVGQLAGDR